MIHQNYLFHILITTNKGSNNKSNVSFTNLPKNVNDKAKNICLGLHAEKTG